MEINHCRKSSHYRCEYKIRYAGDKDAVSTSTNKIRTMSFTSISAPASISKTASSRYPLPRAKRRGVFPSRFLMLTFAPLFMSSFARGMLPRPTALYSKVQPYCENSYKDDWSTNVRWSTYRWFRVDAVSTVVTTIRIWKWSKGWQVKSLNACASVNKREKLIWNKVKEDQRSLFRT